MSKAEKRHDVIETRRSHGMDLEVIDFGDLQVLEEAIAPIFLIPPAGGTCSGGAGSGCVCHPAG